MITVRQVVPRDHAILTGRTARLTVGLDGKVYLGAGADLGRGRIDAILRMNADGSDRTVVETPRPLWGLRNVTANADGVLARCDLHHSPKVTVLAKDFTEVGTRFYARLDPYWRNPMKVEASTRPDGAFYVLNRVLRPDGKTVRDVVEALTPAAPVRVAQDFGLPLPENSELPLDFRLLVRGTVYVYVLYTAPGGSFVRRLVARGGQFFEEGRKTLGVHPDEPSYGLGGWEVDDNDVLYLLRPGQGPKLRRYRLDKGTEKDLGDLALTGGPKWTAEPRTVRIQGGVVFVQLNTDDELFRCYRLSDGAYLRTVEPNRDVLTAVFPGDGSEFGPWTAGTAVPVELTVERHEDGAVTVLPPPRWRVWARTLGCLDYRELALTPGGTGFTIAVPPDLTGLIQLKITAETAGWQRGAEPEWAVRRWLEVRAPGATGSAAVITRANLSRTAGADLKTTREPVNRLCYGRGEPIEAEVLADGAAVVPVELIDGGGRVLAAGKVPPSGAFTVDGRLTALLPPGDYRLRARMAGRTTADQPLRIGPGRLPAPFPYLQYGDYRPAYPWTSPTPSTWDLPDRVVAHLERTRTLGVRMFAERIGGGRKGDLDVGHAMEDTRALRDWLTAHGVVPPERAITLPAASQAVTGYGAYGATLMAILLDMDAGLPFRDGKIDGRTRERLLADIDQVSDALAGEPGFRGWVWAANWWLGSDEHGVSLQDADAQAKTDPEYQRALERSRVTGRWDPVHDTRSDQRLTVAPALWRDFGEHLRARYPGLVTAASGSFNNGNVYAPLSFDGVDEVDLHFQFEGMTVPGWTALAHDLRRRPGKRTLLHAEHNNDPGTGEQVLAMHGLALLRGADSAGTAGSIPNSYRFAPEDGRSGYPGMTSVYRALGALLREHGPWMSTLEGADRLAILLSGRGFRLQSWTMIPVHLRRVHEAYLSCLLAGFPATIVYAEDLATTPLTGFDAILLVDEQFEPEPAVAEAIKAAGVPVFRDGTCNAAAVPESTPLGVSFDAVPADVYESNTDSAAGYWREAVLGHVAELRRVLATVTDPVAEVYAGDDREPEVLVSHRVAEDADYLFVANDALLGLGQGLLARTASGNAGRAPLTARLGLAGREGVVYDVFGGTRVTPVDGAVTAELRHLPFAVFAILPAEIRQVRLVLTLSGREIGWYAEVVGPDGASIPASVGMRIVFRDSAGAVFDERVEVAGSEGVRGTCVPPVTAAGRCAVTATELFSGRAAQATADLPAVPLPLDLTGTGVVTGGPRASAESRAVEPAEPFQPVRSRFGAKLRSVAVSADGTSAVLAGFDWDANTHGIDLVTGAVRWQRRIGQHFAFAPGRAGTGFAVTGTAFDRPQGYGLYLLGADGVPARRFDLYGLPTRLGYRTVQALQQRDDGGFAVAASGSWVASSGSLGIVVWNAAGSARWRRDTPRDAKFGSRAPAVLAAVGESLLVADGTTVHFHQSGAETPLWTVDLLAAQSGTKGPGAPRSLVLSADGRTCAVLTNCRGGLVFVLDVATGRPRATLPVDANQAALSADGSRLAVVGQNQLRCFDLPWSGVERWVYGGDDLLRGPVFAPDGRLAAGTEIGTLVVLDVDGNPVLEKDLEALPAVAWLPGGDLLAATWMGGVHRFGADLQPRWHTRVTCSGPDVRGGLLAPDAVPVTRVDGWGNAEPGPAPLRPNLMAGGKAYLDLRLDRIVDRPEVADGNLTPRIPLPGEWGPVEFPAETPGLESYLYLDLPRRCRVTGVTVVEDARRPESWWRDLRLDYQNAATAWVSAGPLLSDTAVHTHLLAAPVETAKLRLRLPTPPVDLPRQAEVIVHGDFL
ncbi:hypothetical protein [Amycolatopsis minnesotensis]|uniref:Uncharacterized protein n=1 Tax=Amycolatopsis minnesotensis TaxID=337894 RepID=A0ABP5E259_9PSEU